MKKILIGLLSCLVFGANVEAQEVGQQNEALSTIADTAGTATKLATDKKGRLLLSSSVSGVDVVASTLNMTNASGAVQFTCGKYSQVSFSLGRTTETGVVDVALSNDGTNWQQIAMNQASVGSFGLFYDMVSGNALTLASVAAANVYEADCTARYFRVHVNTTGTGTALPVTISGIDGSGIVRGVFPGIRSGNLGKGYNESVPLSTGDVGVAGYYYREAVPSTTGVAAADGRWSHGKVDANGVQYVNSMNASGAGPIGNPFAVGMNAKNVEPALSSNGFIQRMYGDLTGRPIITPYSLPDLSFQACSGSITTTTQTDIKAAAGAGIRNYITAIGCNNTATVASTLVFGDGASAIWQGAIGNSTLNGVAGYTMTFPVPLRTSTNTAFTVTLGTTATATRCCVSGFTSAN